MIKQHKLTNYIIMCSVLYMLMSIPNLFMHNIIEYIIYELRIHARLQCLIMNSISITLIISTTVLYILVLIFIKKLRATDSTINLYNVLLIIITISTITHLYLNTVHGLAGIMLRDKVYLYFQLSFSIMLTLIEIIFYIKIIKKEAPNYNWMLIGGLITSTIVLFRYIIDFFRYHPDSRFEILTAQYFDQTHPLLASLLNNVYIATASSLLWVIGAIILALNTKKQLKKA